MSIGLAAFGISKGEAAWQVAVENELVEAAARLCERDKRLVE